MIEFAGGVCLIVAVTLGGLLLQTSRRLHETRLACAGFEHERATALAVLDTVPLAGFRWSRGIDDQEVAVRAEPYPQFLARLNQGDAERIEAARQALRRGGTALSFTVRTRNEEVFGIEGRRTATGESVLWLLDKSAAARASEEREEAARLRELIDAVPVPMWRSDPERGLVECNRAYAVAVDATRKAALVQNLPLASSGVGRAAIAVAGTAATDRRVEHRHVVINGARRLLEISELPGQDGATLGFALDRTEVEAAEAELQRHINAQAAVLEGIGAAVAIYGADKRLKFFNSAFAILWGLEPGWLAGEPSFGDVLERLREHRRIPERADFAAFKRERIGLFTSLIEPQNELMHLPDERTLKVSISPHPFGGLTFVYENVTDRLALERSCNTLTQVRRATFDNLFEGVAVYGSDGRLKLHNPAYLQIWGLSPNDVAGEPHIAEILEKTRTFLDDGGDWVAIKQSIVAKVLAHTPTSGPLYRCDGSMLQVASVPLPDGNVLLTYLDVTDTARVERALRERNEALETASRLKSEFIANVSHELRTPLNAVIGFAEILTNQYFGDLNARQLDYSQSILASARLLMRLINDILDLATIEAGYMVLETGANRCFRHDPGRRFADPRARPQPGSRTGAGLPAADRRNRGRRAAAQAGSLQSDLEFDQIYPARRRDQRRGGARGRRDAADGGRYGCRNTARRSRARKIRRRCAANKDRSWSLPRQEPDRTARRKRCYRSRLGARHADNLPAASPRGSYYTRQHGSTIACPDHPSAGVMPRRSRIACLEARKEGRKAGS